MRGTFDASPEGERSVESQRKYARRVPRLALRASGHRPRAGGGLEPPLLSVPALSMAIFSRRFFRRSSIRRPSSAHAIAGDRRLTRCRESQPRGGWGVRRSRASSGAEIGSRFDGPIIGAVVANGDAVPRFRRLSGDETGRHPAASRIARGQTPSPALAFREFPGCQNLLERRGQLGAIVRSVRLRGSAPPSWDQAASVRGQCRFGTLRHVGHPG